MVWDYHKPRAEGYQTVACWGPNFLPTFGFSKINHFAYLWESTGIFPSYNKATFEPFVKHHDPFICFGSFQVPRQSAGPLWEFPWLADDLTWGTTQQRYRVLRVRLPPYLLHTVGRGMRWNSWNRENLLGGGQIFWWIRKMWSHGVYMYIYIVLFLTYIYTYIYIYIYPM